MMKRWLRVVFGTSLLVALPLGAIVSAQSVINKATCTYNGKPLYGKIKIRPLAKVVAGVIWGLKLDDC
ncbi:hypothetical protein [Trichocoleus sp. DQ-U1]|uniref:hypothetical protein n=1 Tax=Trichocoleus sp. DQ-U1 TaxID=2933926 RepID=UPI003299AF33